MELIKDNPLNIVGKVKDAHGLRGELYLIFFAEGSPWKGEQGNRLMLTTSRDLESPASEFEIVRERPHKKGAIVNLRELTNRTQAEKLKGAFVVVFNEMLDSKPGEKLFLSEIQGFDVYHQEGARIGEISGFSSNGPQDLIEVVDKGSTYQVPLVEDFIVKIDWSERTIIMDLPDGLLGEA